MQMTKAVVAGFGVVAVATLTAAQADAATAYMGGLFGGTPYFSTITGPNGERVNTSWTIFGGDERIQWDNISQASAERAQIAWLEAHQGEQNELWVYSASANSINAVANTRPELLANTTVIAIAPPRAGQPGYQQVQPPSTAKIYQVIVDGDSVADEDGTSLNTHTNGYRNLNMQTQQPVSSVVLNGTNTTRSYYQKPVSTTSRFNLFDMRTWFKPRATTAQVSADAAEVETADRGGAVDAKPTKSEQRKAERAEKAEQKRADRAERAERKAAERAERKAAKQAEREDKADDADAGDDE